MSRAAILVHPRAATPPPPAAYGATPPTGGIVPGSVRCTTAAAFTTALNSGALDITLDAVVTAPSGGFDVPSTSATRTVRGSDIALIQTTSGPCLVGAAGGSYIIDHVRCDGGWRSNKTHTSGTDIPIKFAGANYVSFRNCVSCYSKDLAFLLNGSNQVEILNCTLFCTATGAYADDNVRDLLVQDCWFQFGGDDSVQWHQTPDINFVRTNSVIHRHNLIHDYHGGKTHTGMLTGTYNGKVSQSLWENNLFEGNNRYGFDFNNAAGSASFHGPPENFKFLNNTIKNLRTWGASARNFNSKIGIGLIISLQTGNSFDSTCEIRNNTFIRDPSLQGLRQQDVYDWAAVGATGKPPWVPGAETMGGGFWSEVGFKPDFTIDLASKGVNLSGDNSAAVVHSGNTFVGSGWTSTIS